MRKKLSVEERLRRSEQFIRNHQHIPHGSKFFHFCVRTGGSVVLILAQTIREALEMCVAEFEEDSSRFYTAERITMLGWTLFDHVVAPDRPQITFLQPWHPYIKTISGKPEILWPQQDPKNSGLAVTDLNLGIRAYNVLKSAEINTLAELVARKPTEVGSLRNMGRRAFEEIENAIAVRAIDWA